MLHTRRAPADSEFNTTFANKGSVVGERALVSAYAWVTASGTAVSTWGGPVTVQCHTPTGVPVDAPFSLAYLGKRTG